MFQKGQSMMEKKQVEILAPAGSWDSMKAAVAAGADAVYMGGSRFGARAYADNSDEKELVEAIDYVHLHGRKLYMTVNTLFKERELKDLAEYMRPYYLAGLDGAIVQDLGALQELKTKFPGLELHASTQMTITSLYGARMMKELGCSRIVTAREMSLAEIRRLHDAIDVEIESFVHGALCYCYSGQCLMSSLIGGRSANRGRCAQTCRLPYTVYERSQPQKPLNQKHERHVLSMKDLCTLDLLPDIIEAGVYSLKIEGRMKRSRYTAGVVRIYRKYTDLYLEQGREGYYVEPEDRKELLELFDRGGFTSGYYDAHNGREMLALRAKPEFREGNPRLFSFLDQTYVEAELKEPVEGYITLEQGLPARLTLRSGKRGVAVEGQAPKAALKQPITRETVERQLKKTGGTPFTLTRLTTDIKGELFLPVQALNELRRKGFEALQEKVLEPYRRNIKGYPATEWAETDRKQKSRRGNGAKPKPSVSLALQMSVSLEDLAQLPPALACKEAAAIYIDAGAFPPESWKETAGRCHKRDKSCYLMLPQIFREHAIRYFKTNKALLNEAGFDGVIIKALEEVQWLREAGVQLPFKLDASVYGWNTRAVGVLAQTGAKSLTLPLELNVRELEPVLSACSDFEIPAELMVYGHAPMMVSAQCITRTSEGCCQKPGSLMLKDRTGAFLPVKNHCAFCYNTIYNPSPTSLLGYEMEVKALGVYGIRLAFTLEDATQAEAVLDAFSRAFFYGETVKVPYREFTRGHFKRGVE